MSVLSEILEDLRNRPRMFLPDGRYATLVAFIEGVAQGESKGPLTGFQDWLSDRQGASSLHWAEQVADEFKVGNPRQLTPESEDLAKSALLDTLALFFSETEPDSAPSSAD